ncbi:MAG: M28 family metallopeptidase [Armatimonadota bacterium]|nr:M28 family metallopeptidase [Armatimonadota bacterium]MDR7450710.1 M28 family metallopeptidase [Armatimonadota bacterium]MDR7466066.1 M28 family metallopeptidase [Armatimonadota bacterium]MDR7493897.1 M28 family metallopeptidase [Armatimonadota bacterium]MDR7504002.1 M28 family metallopeptidase [Armatimonadota bacterium]
MTYRDPHESVLLQDISLDAPRELIHRFARLVRESGSEAEWTAAREVAGRLAGWGIPHTVHEPLLYLSVPERASVEVLEPEPRTIRAKTPSFSASTDGRPLRGRVVYLPSSHGVAADTFDAPLGEATEEIRGRIALTEGFPSPQKVLAIQQRGAAGIIFIHPGEAIHEMICTTIWGAPDLDSLPRKPAVPVTSVNHTDGARLVALCRNGGLQVALQTRLREGWMRCPVVVAEIPGADEPEVFLLAHGHIDSWHVGIGDNATGDAALLELARLFWRHRARLRRSLRVAWWPGHSTGRYAGSTWYADTHALELVERCLAHMNIDSPGCRWATAYEDISWMPEAEAFCQAAIRDATGQPSIGERPHRAGDWSFNNLGLTGFYMLFSTMPKPLLREKGFYPVGGCGGNIAWHTEDDTLEIFDEANLARDLRAYVITILRALNAPIHPFDLRAVTREFHTTLAAYQADAGDHFDFRPAREAVDALEAALDRFYDRCRTLAARPVGDPAVRAANATLRRIRSLLVTLNFARADRFRHDPAVPIPPLPDLAPARQLAGADPVMRGFLQTHLLRGQNRVVWTLREARLLAESASEAR